MAALELALFAWDSLTVMGKLFFFAMVGAGSVAWDALQLISLAAISLFECLSTAGHFLGLLLCQFMSLVAPYIADFGMTMLMILYSSGESIINLLFDYFIGTWTSPAFVNLRENFLDGFCNGAEAVWKSGLERPMWTAQCVSSGIWIILITMYRKDLMRLFERAIRRAGASLVFARNGVVHISRELLYWTLSPVRLVCTFPAKMKEASSAFWRYAISWINFRLPLTSPDQLDGAGRVVPKSLPGRGSSIFGRVQKTDTMVSLEQLRDDLRALRTQLEEERESKLCIICQSNFRAVVCMPCKHFATCEECMTLLPINFLSRKVCPVCRTPISTTIKVYL